MCIFVLFFQFFALISHRLYIFLLFSIFVFFSIGLEIGVRALMNLYYLLFLSCSRAWKKHKLWYKPSDNFFCILLFKLYSIFTRSRQFKQRSYTLDIIA